MAFGTSGPANGLYQPRADINVTPLVDVMLVLLIIFMVTAPLLATGLKVDLPQAKLMQPLNPKEPIAVTVTKDNKLALGGDVIEKDKLVDALLAKSEGDRNRLVHLRGDKEVPFGDVVAIMDLLATNGLIHLAIVTNTQEHGDTQKTKPAGEGDPVHVDAAPAGKDPDRQEPRN